KEAKLVARHPWRGGEGPPPRDWARPCVVARALARYHEHHGDARLWPLVGERARLPMETAPAPLPAALIAHGHLNCPRLIVVERVVEFPSDPRLQHRAPARQFVLKVPK